MKLMSSSFKFLVEKQFNSSQGLSLDIVVTKNIKGIAVTKTNDLFHDIKIHCYINLPGYNYPPEVMNSDTHVVK